VFENYITDHSSGKSRGKKEMVLNRSFTCPLTSPFLYLKGDRGGFFCVIARLSAAAAISFYVLRWRRCHEVTEEDKELRVMSPEFPQYHSNFNLFTLTKKLYFNSLKTSKMSPDFLVRENLRFPLDNSYHGCPPNSLHVSSGHCLLLSVISMYRFDNCQSKIH